MIYYEEDIKEYNFWVISEGELHSFCVGIVDRMVNRAEVIITLSSCDPTIKVTIKGSLPESEKEVCKLALQQWFEHNDIDYVSID